MKLLAGVIVVCVLAVFGLGLIKSLGNSSSTNSTKLQVAASFYPIHFLVSQVGGENVDVTSIVPNGTEPHEYDLTTQDLKVIAESKIVFVNGGIEPWGEKLDSVTYLGKPYFVNDDPHVWLDPLLAIKMTADIADVLAKVDPENAAEYKKNASDLITQLDELDTEMRNGLAQCNQRTFVTSHAAFGYLASRYNLVQEEISGLSTEDEPTAARMAEISALVKNRQIKYIFFESLVPQDLANTIALETGAKTLELNPLESTDQDYFSVQKINLTNLKLALECK